MSLPPVDYARNMRLIGHSDQGGRGDGLQVMVHRGYAYVAHPWSGGFSIIDVRDPSRPGETTLIPAPPNTWTIHLQTHDDLLLVVHALDIFANITFDDEHSYYSSSMGDLVGAKSRNGAAPRPWSSGVAIYDISQPTRPRQIGFFPVDGIGVHRIWYIGGDFCYMSALFNGYSDYILAIVNIADPTRPFEAGRFWLDGMHTAGGEVPSWPAGKRHALHHAVISGETAYACWRDGGLTLIDIADKSAPKLIAHRNWCPPYGGGTHSALPLPDRNLLLVADEAVADNEQDGRKHTWVFDIRSPDNPVSISTFPIPKEADYTAKGGHFGPHNLHENRPGSFQSSEIIFATWQNAGIRAFNIADPYHPREIGALVPSAPTKIIDRRPGRPPVIQSADVFADRNGILYATDYNAGLSIIEFGG
ncbi:LVIVD repeat-containing protein [Oryzibacter oryziterrae]|uniref:LVIVD repeat-containing protein n=1 Tax=Oryzibacter oryziterrae TaxID=2766474 RepID=UPI001F30E117|nr:hypothetical protein [Oryzibacter oryziterrae]